MLAVDVLGPKIKMCDRERQMEGRTQRNRDRQMDGHMNRQTSEGLREGEDKIYTEKERKTERNKRGRRRQDTRYKKPKLLDIKYTKSLLKNYCRS